MEIEFGPGTSPLSCNYSVNIKLINIWILCASHWIGNILKIRVFVAFRSLVQNLSIYAYGIHGHMISLYWLSYWHLWSTFCMLSFWQRLFWKVVIYSEDLLKSNIYPSLSAYTMNLTKLVLHLLYIIHVTIFVSVKNADLLIFISIYLLWA